MDLIRIAARVAAGQSEIVINSYSNVAVRTPDVRGQLREWMLEQASKGEVIGADGEPVTPENVDGQLASVPDDMLGEAFDGFLVTGPENEGAEGVAVGFVSSDRQAIVFAWPIPEDQESEFWGNFDPTVYKTAGVADGVEVRGEQGFLPAG